MSTDQIRGRRMNRRIFLAASTLAGAAGLGNKQLNRYHWWVLLVASLGWLFDTMDQRILVLARGPAIADLLPVGAFFGIYAFTKFTVRAGRRRAFAVAFLLGLGATVLTFGWLREPSHIYWMIPILGFCNVAVFGGYSIYLPELYPTRLRSAGVGFCYNGGRVVAALGPFTLGGLTVHLADAGFAAPFRRSHRAGFCLRSRLGGGSLRSGDKGTHAT